MPRYLDLAAELQKSITDGRTPVGAQLPTEHALCADYGVSRHTARAALKVLEDQGLIERRPGLGTRVVRAPAPPQFTQPLGGLDALLQYAHEARLRAISVSTERLAAAEARRVGAIKDSVWLRIDGVRRADGAPLAATTIRVAGWVGAAAVDLRHPRLAITEQIERKFGVTVDRIVQQIAGGLLSPADARLLGVAPGAASLITLRRYYDAADRPFVISLSRHPADRFAYEMSFRREKPGS